MVVVSVARRAASDAAALSASSGVAPSMTIAIRSPRCGKRSGERELALAPRRILGDQLGGVGVDRRVPRGIERGHCAYRCADDDREPWAARARRDDARDQRRQRASSRWTLESRVGTCAHALLLDIGERMRMRQQ
jgi:hypothetical protein